jgi:hypothetical protein
VKSGGLKSGRRKGWSLKGLSTLPRRREGVDGMTAWMGWAASEMLIKEVAIAARL